MPAIYKVVLCFIFLSKITSHVSSRKSANRGMFTGIIVIQRYRSVVPRK